MTKKVTKPVAQDDFLTQEFDLADAPAIPAAILPFFQFNSGAGVFEFPLAITEKVNGKPVEKPIWSRILRDTKLKPQQINHNGHKFPAYVFDEIHFALMGEHVYWYDKNGLVPGRFENRPNPQPEGSYFVSKRLLVGYVQEIEAVAPGTLCYLTVTSMQAKFTGEALKSFDKAVLLPAHAARLTKLQLANPNYPNPETLLFPRYAFWMQLRGGEAINVSKDPSRDKFIPPIVGAWNLEGESVQELRGLFITGGTKQLIQDTRADAKRWVAAQEARWVAELDNDNIEISDEDAESNAEFDALKY